MNVWFAWAASAASLATCLGHAFMGGPNVAKPLLASDQLTLQAKLMGYFCWHVTTIVVLAMSVGFALVALRPQETILTTFLAVLSGAIWLLSIGITAFGRLPVSRNPGVWFFGLITFMGAAAAAS